MTSGLTSGRMVTVATDGFMAGTSTTTAITCESLGNEQLELESLGDERMERCRRVQQRSQRTDAVKSFIFRGKEHEPVDQLPLQVQ